MSDTEDANGTITPPPHRRLRLAELQNFCSGLNSRDRVLALLEKTTAGELLQQTAAAADALALRQGVASETDDAAERRAVNFATAAEDDEAAKDMQQLLDLLLKAIRRCFEVEELRDAILSQSEMRPLLSAAANSPFPVIRELLAQQLKQIAKRGEKGVEFLWSLDLHRHLICLLEDSETSVATPAEAALAAICALECSPRFVLEGAFLAELRRLASDSSETISFRVLGPLVHGVLSHREFFDALRSAAPEMLARVQHLLSDKEDLLVQANACDLLSSLITVSWGLDYAISEKYPELVARLIAEEGIEEGDELENQNMLRLLCNMATQRAAECGRVMELESGLLTKTIELYLTSPSKRRREEGMLCWGVLCSTSECAATVLEKLPSSADCVAAAVADVEELSVAALRSWLCVVQDVKDPSVLPETLLQTVNSKLTPRLLDCILQRPFPESRQKAYELLKALVTFAEPMQTLFASSSFRKLILDPTSDSAYEVRIAKHAFACAACEAQGEWLKEALDPAFSNEFFRYAKAGPFATSSSARSFATST